MPSALSKIRFLTIALLISGALNIFLSCLFVSWLIRSYCAQPLAVSAPLCDTACQSQPLGHTLVTLKNTPYSNLIGQLECKQLVECGYTIRDIALAVLIHNHGFNLAQALRNSVYKSQPRCLSVGQGEKLTVYCGLEDRHYQAIIDYAKTEKWPFTSRALYDLLCREEGIKDLSLVQAFSLTPEFQTVETLFARSSGAIKKSKLLELVRQGPWDIMAMLAKQYRLCPQFSPEMRQKFLLNYVAAKSICAAELIVRLDPLFAAYHLDDAKTLDVLRLLKTKKPCHEQFALHLLMSPRSNVIWQAAIDSLYLWAGETPPQGVTPLIALKRFTPQGAPQSEVTKRDPLSPSASLACAAVSPPPPTCGQKPAPAIQNPALGNSLAVKSGSLPPHDPVCTGNSGKVVAVKHNTQKAVQKLPAKAGLQQESVPTLQPPQPKKSIPASPLPEKNSPKLYIVQEGDSLWKIANRFHVDLAQLRTCNRLHSDELRPGKALAIP